MHEVLRLSNCPHGMSEALTTCGMDISAVLNSSRPDNSTLSRAFPTSVSTAVDPSSDRLENVYVYVSIFLGLLLFLLLLLVIALHRLKNNISSSSSYPERTSNGGNSLANIEICSLSTVSSLSS